MEIDEQIAWLERELTVASRQANSEINRLTNRIRDLQKMERKTEQQNQSQENHEGLSEHFV